MKRLYHPRLRDVSVDVEDDVVKDWTDAGWLDTEPRTTATTPTPEPSANTGDEGDNSQEG